MCFIICDLQEEAVTIALDSVKAAINEDAISMKVINSKIWRMMFPKCVTLAAER